MLVLCNLSFGYLQTNVASFSFNSQVSCKKFFEVDNYWHQPDGLQHWTVCRCASARKIQWYHPTLTVTYKRTQHSTRTSVTLQLISRPIEHQLHKSSAFWFENFQFIHQSINQFILARKSSLNGLLFVGKYNMVVPQYRWYCNTTVVPWPRRE